MTAVLAPTRVHLPDQSDSSSEEGSPRKRPRRDNEEEDEVLPSKNEWEHYVRSGAKLKSLAETALSALDRTKALVSTAGEHNELSINPSTDVSPRDNAEKANNSAQLALEKTTECLILEKVCLL